MIDELALKLIASKAKGVDMSVWWAAMLNLSKGNINQVLDLLKRNGLPSDNLLEAHKALQTLV